MKMKKMSLFIGTIGAVLMLNSTSVMADKDQTQIKKYNTDQMILISDSEDYCVKQMEQTFFCNAKSGLNIREFCTSDSRIIGGYEFGERIIVKGEVFLKEESTNWMCDDGSVWNLAYNGANDNVEIESGSTTAEDIVELINARGDTTTAYLLADGSYMDRIDRIFLYDGKETWNCSDGSQWNKTVD